MLADGLVLAGRRDVVTGSWGAAEHHLSAAARLAPERSVRERLTLEAVECQLLGDAVADPADLAVRLRDQPSSPRRSYVLAGLDLVTGRFVESDALLRDAWLRCGDRGDPAVAARVVAQLATLCLLCAHGQEADWADLALRLAPGPGCRRDAAPGAAISGREDRGGRLGSRRLRRGPLHRWRLA
ncbi:MAG TPA: hypothetical protein VK908_09895 [Jiangellales bacterium]|nr:hypothetical protein [Jiangellales bacterium]